MNKQALFHQAKSEYSYAYDSKTLHITFRTARDDFDSVKIVYGDPFKWVNKIWQSKTEIMTKRYQTMEFDYYFIAIEPENFRCKYAFILTKNNESFFFGSKRLKAPSEGFNYQLQNLSEYFNYPYLNHEDVLTTPSWVKDTVWYQIFPDRFYNEGTKSNLKWGKLPVKNFEIYGGNLKGIIKKLPYLQSLGITGLYFTPIFESLSAHKYDTINYFKIDPSFGTNEDFLELVKKAHALGIRVVLDAVFNHCGYLHPYFQDLVKNNENSIYKDCFFVNRFPIKDFSLNELGLPTKYDPHNLSFRTFAHTPAMPKWNTDNEITKKHLLDVVSFWLKEYHIDGWRLDVSNEISHDFLRDVKRVSKKVNKDSFIFGENWDQSYPWLMGDQLDAVMNYELSYIIWNYLEHKIDTKEYIDLLESFLALTPKHVIMQMFNLLGCHDTVRIKRRLEDDPRRVKLAFLLMFLSPGSPNIYYGDEVGMTGDNDPDNRRTMIWDEKKIDQDFLNFIIKIIALRKTNTTFSLPDYTFIDHKELLIFKKTSVDEAILVIINNSNNKVTYEHETTGKSYVNLITNENFVFNGKISMEPYSYLLLKEV